MAYSLTLLDKFNIFHAMNSSLRNIFRTLRYRNYRLFFVGQGISLVGTWIQQIAMSWLAYRLTNSALMLGIVGFSTQIPTFILSPFAGVLTDRYNRQRIIIMTQTLAMLQAFIIAFLTIGGLVKVWHIMVLGVFLGCVNSFDAPARQSFIIHLVEKKENLGNAIALNSFIFNGARLIGPAVAGILISAAGEGVCFLLNGISFLAVIGCLLAMRINIEQPKVRHSHMLHSLKEGIVYAFGFPPIKFILLLLGCISLMGMSYAVLMPVFAGDVLHGGPDTLGFLMGSVGIGALAGTFFLASKTKIIKPGMIIPVSSGIFGLGLILFSFSNRIWLSMIILFLCGFGFMVHMVSSNTVLQTIVDETKRGRVMSFYTMAFLGMAPLGSLLAGALANKIGAPNALAISGSVCILASMAFAFKIPFLRKTVHPIYEKIMLASEITIMEDD